MYWIYNNIIFSGLYIIFSIIDLVKLLRKDNKHIINEYDTNLLDVMNRYSKSYKKVVFTASFGISPFLMLLSKYAPSRNYLYSYDILDNFLI